MKSKKKSIKSNKKEAKLTLNSKTYTLPILKASEGSDVINITKLYSRSVISPMIQGLLQPPHVSQKLLILMAKKEYLGIGV